MPLLLEQSPTDQGHQNLLGQHLRTILEIADELVSQMPLEAQIWATQVRQELHKGVDLIEQELELLGLHQICALRRALDERDHQIVELRARISPPGPPTYPSGRRDASNGGEAPLVSPQFMDAAPSVGGVSELRVSPDPIAANPIPSDTLENLFEDLEGLSVQSSRQMPTLSDQQIITDVMQPVEAVEGELQTIATTELSSPKVPDLAESETLRQEFQQLQADLVQQKQQIASITSVVDQQKAENQQLQSLVSSLEEKLSQKETDLEKSMIRSLLLEAGLDPDVA
jgi:hypothetical protein